MIDMSELDVAHVKDHHRLRAELASTEKARDEYLRMARLHGDDLIETQGRLREATKTIESKDAEIDRVLEANGRLRGDLDEAEAGKDRLEEECARLRADQTKYHQNLTEIAQQHVKDRDRISADKDELWTAIRGRDEKINKLVKELAAARQGIANVLKEHRERLQANAELRAELDASERARLIAIAVQQELSDELAVARSDISKWREIAALSNEVATARSEELATVRQDAIEKERQLAAARHDVGRMREALSSIFATRHNWTNEGYTGAP